ncbi:hypothetical protein [Streptomyces sp.]|uniref:hypothetical protein n=1 Tax=Streptomyces sp. TaxID=1931 RepID=UPI002F9470CC
MELAGWVTVVTAAIAGAFTVVGHLVDQVSMLSQKVIIAVRAVREVRDEVRSDRE